MNPNDPKKNDPGKRPGQNNDNDRKSRNIVILVIAALVATLLINMVYTSIANSYLEEISYNEFTDLLDGNEVDSVLFTTDRRIEILTHENAQKPEAQQHILYTGLLPNVELSSLVEKLEKNGISYGMEIEQESSPIVSFLVSWVFPMAFMYLLFALLMRGMSKRMGGGIGESKAKVYMEKQTGVTFADVAGQDEAKESLV
ncbi:MAG: ATP-dependent metallopeptidase FtsH/Yme1/Tma family protein, partial [Oscillospiraceae bacterium]|nr:ATP-dependent metallopeptidase FtsH/Yme1/Tma family protein [Oscillospiraceae bacterium]